MTTASNLHLRRSLHRKPVPFTGGDFTFPPSPTSSASPSPVLAFRGIFGSPVLAALSDPEPLSSPSSSERGNDSSYAGSEDESDSFRFDFGHRDDDESDDDVVRKGMPRLHSFLLGQKSAAAQGLAINFARPFPAAATIDLAETDTESSDDSDDHERPGKSVFGMIRDPATVEHLFGRSIQRSRRTESSEGASQTFTVPQLSLDSATDLPTLLAPTSAPSLASGPAIPERRTSISPSIPMRRVGDSLSARSDSESSTTSSPRMSRRAAARSAYRDELGDLAGQEAPVAKVVKASKGLGLQVGLEEQGRRKGLDFGTTSEHGVLASRSTDSIVHSDTVDLESNDEDSLAGHAAAWIKKQSAASKIKSSLLFSRPATPILPPSPSLESSPSASSIPSVPELPSGYSAANAHAFFTSTIGALAHSSSSDESLSSPIETAEAGWVDVAPVSARVPFGYSTRQHSPPPAATFGLKELRELRGAAAVLEHEARKQVRTVIVEKKLKRKPVPVELDVLVLDSMAIKEMADEIVSLTSSPSSSAEVLAVGQVPVFPALNLKRASSVLMARPPRSTARPVSMLVRSHSDEPSVFSPVLLSTLSPTISEEATFKFPRPPSVRSLPTDSTAGDLDVDVEEVLAPIAAPASFHEMLTTFRAKSSRRASISSRRSSTSSFESYPHPPTPLEASFFPPVASPTLQMDLLLPTALRSLEQASNASWVPPPAALAPQQQQQQSRSSGLKLGGMVSKMKGRMSKPGKTLRSMASVSA